jgi:hypothetical protein
VSGPAGRAVIGVPVCVMAAGMLRMRLWRAATFGKRRPGRTARRRAG